MRLSLIMDLADPPDPRSTSQADPPHPLVVMAPSLVPRGEDNSNLRHYSLKALASLENDVRWYETADMICHSPPPPSHTSPLG